MTKQHAQLVMAMAENNLNTSKTALTTIYHRNTIMYHLNLIKKETGLDPRVFYDMCKLLPLAQAVLDESDT